MSLNKVMLIGRLGADPEVRYMTNGDVVSTLRVATTRKWKDRNTNEKKEETEWHRVTYYSALAKVAADYLKKGSQVYIEGRIKTNKWQDNDGKDQYSTGIVGESLIMLDSKGNTQQTQNNDNPRKNNDKPEQISSSGYDDFDDDIPFSSLNVMIKNHLI